MSGSASHDEIRAVMQWFATDEGQKYLSTRMDGDFAEIKEGYEEAYVPHAIPSENIWNKIERRTFYKTRRFNPVLRIAAVLIPFFIVLSVVLYRVNVGGGAVEYAEIYVPKGERMELTLDDGTQVFLNSDTRLSYPAKFARSERKVMLQGEAYFDVEKDARRPFIIEMSDASIEVLGTAFNVKSYDDDSNIDVALDNGKIKLVSALNKKYELLPQERLVYNKNTAVVEISKNDKTENASRWKNDVLLFENASLTDVMKTLNRQYNVKFMVLDKEAYNYSYTFTAKKAELKDILSDMEKISPVRFTYKNDTVKVKMNH